MRKPSAPLLAAVGLAVVVAAAGSARAQRGVDSELFRPALDSYGIFTVDRAQTSHQWDLRLQALRRLRVEPAAPRHLPPIRRPARSARAPSADLTAVMGWQAALHFGFHLGLTDWLELVADLPVSAEGYTARVRPLRLRRPIRRIAGAPASTPLGASPTSPPPNAAPIDWRARLQGAPVPHRHLRPRRSPPSSRCRSATTRPSSATAASPSAPTLIADFTRGAVHRRHQRRRHHPPRDHRLRAERSGAASVAQPRSLIDVGHELTWSAGVAYRFVHWVGIAAEVFGYVPLVGTSGPLDAGKDYTADVARRLPVLPGQGRHRRRRRRRRRHRLRAAPRRLPRLRRHQLGAGRGQGRRRPRRHRHRRRRHPRRAATRARTSPRTRTASRTRTAAPIPTTTATASPTRTTSARTSPRTRTASRTTTAAPISTTTATASPTRRTSARTSRRTRTASRTTTAAPISTTTATASPTRTTSARTSRRRATASTTTTAAPTRAVSVAIAGGKIELPENIQLRDAAPTRIAGRSRGADRARRREDQGRTRSVKRIRIEGHTDDVGGAKKNQELSQARAESVRNFLIRKGVEPERLQAVGYGDTRPLDKRKTAEARAKNRRVEFIIVEQ